MVRSLAVVAALAGQALAFPWVAESVGMSERDFPVNMGHRRQAKPTDPCPNNPNHQGAVPFNPKYPYCGAKNGLPGNQTCVNNQVPAPGDTAHKWIAPTKLDIRGPCPGLNTAANHGFLSRDGIVTFTELIDAQQNVYGVGYDLAVLLAVLGVGLDGDPVTGKLSLGCDATARTAAPGLGPEPGLAGHNKFEGDTSLTRNDYFPAKGDDYHFNSTLFAYQSAQCAVNNAGCNLANIARYRYQRYQDSLNHNGNFYFGPKSILLYGASSFLYELFPSKGDLGKPDQTTMNYFFVREQLPPNWYSRVQPYTIPDVANQINNQYQLYPVAFGGNTGNPNSFVGIGEYGPYISNNMFSGTPQGVACLLYQVATENAPSALGGGGQTTPAANFAWAISQLNPIYQSGDLANFGCPLKLT